MKKSIAVLFLVLFLAPAISFAAFDTSLKYGSRGDAVTELQDFLSDQGNYSGKVDGKFGFGTLKAVRAFQSANGLSVDGYFGIASRAKANDILSVLLDQSNAAEQQETGNVNMALDMNGCSATANYSVTTGRPCNGATQPVANLIEGCLGLSGYSMTSGKKCDGTVETKLDTINSTLGSIVNNTLPPPPVVTPPTPTPIPVPAPIPVPKPDPLVFTQRPKIVFSGDSLARMTWETNRPSRIVMGPVIQNPADPTGKDWTTAYGDITFQSCGKYGISKYIDTTCKIQAKDDSGMIAEVNVTVFGDSIDISTLQL